jgi:protein-disulfide isomerase
MKLKLFLSIVALTLLSACTGTPLPENRTPPTLGSATAPILVEEFSDFQCPACAQISPQVEAIVRKYPEKIRFTYRHFPLSYHEWSLRAAQAAECAGDQGKFFEYGDLLFKNQKSFSEDKFVSLATEAGLDSAKLKECLDSEVKKGDVLVDLREGQKRGLPGTPTIYVNGQRVQFGGADVFEKYLLSL